MSPSFETEVMVSPWLRELLTRSTSAVEASARALAPRHLGFLIESIESEVGLEDGRIIGRVRATDFKAGWHEFGTRNMHAHPFLLPALLRELPGATITGGDRSIR